ncbi:MAG: cupin domain-containing protein [Planctomycetaceae bacterium]
MAQGTIQAVTGTAVELPEMPIDADWIIEGNPQARGTVLVQSQDQLLSSGLWSCTAGRFRWEFGWDEFVHVLEGEVIVSDCDGHQVTLTAGDTAHFPLGLSSEWYVPEFVKKAFTIRTPEPFVL